MANIRDIAKLTGVSVATVSRALQRPEVVADSTRKIVEEAARKLGYQPNALSRALRRQHSYSIVVVVPYIHNPFYSGVVQGIENVAHANSYKVLLGESQGSQQRLDTYGAMLLTKEADGLILLGAMLPTSLQPTARHPERRFPVVMACEYVPGFDAPNVRIDNAEAAAEMTDHLIGLGHRRIALIRGPSHNPLSADRLKGYRNRMSKQGLPVPAEYLVKGDFSAESGYQGMQKLLALSSRPTAIFCANDEMAMGAIRAAKEAKLRVPQDVSVVGFDDIRFSEFVDPPLTTIGQPQLELGETAMRLMLDVLAGRSAAKAVVLPHRLILRGSSRSPK